MKAKTPTSLSVIGSPEPEEQPFWRSVTDEDVRNAISGSYLIRFTARLRRIILRALRFHCC